MININKHCDLLWKIQIKNFDFLCFSSETVFSGVRRTKTLMAVFHDASYRNKTLGWWLSSWIDINRQYNIWLER